jgi:hypothetical protein
VGGGTKIVVTLYCFARVLCLNYKHVIILKDFHNFLHIMVGQNSKKLNAKETTFFISYDVMLEYICAKKIIHHNILKIANIFMNGLK